MALETLFHDRNGNAFGRLDDRLFVQARTGVLTMATLEAADDNLKKRPLLGVGGALAVVNGDAGIMPADIRARQMEFLKGLLAGGSWMVTVVRGETVHASTMRSLGRMMLLGQQRLRHMADVGEAARFLGGVLDLDAARIEAAVADLHVLARKSP
ncbi:MAG TPA: hypothetical protein VGF99_22455 [Myxococcota bacterium]